MKLERLGRTMNHIDCTVPSSKPSATRSGSCRGPPKSELQAKCSQRKISDWYPTMYGPMRTSETDKLRAPI